MRFLVKTIELNVDAMEYPLVTVTLFNQEHVGHKKEDLVDWARTVVELFACGELEIEAVEQEEV